MDNEDMSVAVILGAGASSVLGFPLQNQLWDFLLEQTPCPDTRRQLKAFKARYGTDLEEAFTIYEIARRNLDGALIDDNVPGLHLELIIDVIDHHFSAVVFPESGRRTYKRFIGLLTQHFNSISLISLNWDTSLEQVLREMELCYSYGIVMESA